MKWQVNERDKSGPSLLKKEAEKIRQKLERAKEDNLDFFPNTCEPIEWPAGDMTFMGCLSAMTKLRARNGTKPHLMIAKHRH